MLSESSSSSSSGGVDLDEEDDEEEAAKAKRPRTSTPINTHTHKTAQPFIPKQHAIPTTQTFAKNTIMDVNHRLHAKVKDLERQLHVKEGKEVCMKKMESDLRMKTALLHAREEELEKLKAELSKVKEDKVRSQRESKEALDKLHTTMENAKKETELALEEKVKEADTWRSAVEKLHSSNNQLKEKLEEERKKAEGLRRANDQPISGTLHIECINGRLGETIIDHHDSNESVFCPSNEERAIRCHHVILKGSDIACRVKNARWYSERKLTIILFLL